MCFGTYFKFFFFIYQYFVCFLGEAFSDSFSILIFLMIYFSFPIKKKNCLGLYPEEKVFGRNWQSTSHTWFRSHIVALLDHVNDKIVCRLEWNVTCFSLILLSPKLFHSTSSFIGLWSAPDRRNRCCAGCPRLNGTYCWGLKQSKCPAQAEGQVNQKAAASTSFDL